MTTIKNLFWNSEEARLRAGWRVVVFWSGAVLSGLALLRLRDSVPTGLLPAVYRNLVEAGLYFILVGLVLLWLVGTRLDRRSIADYGFHLSTGWWFDLGFGLALGALLLFGIFALELAMGWIKVTGTFATADPGLPFGPAILAGFLAVLLIALQEEVAWRAYPIKNLAEGLNWKVAAPVWATVIAVLISSVLFGLAHSDNPNATTLSTINIVGFGVVFAAGYVLTGELALPIGFHLAWDFVQAFGLGFSGGAHEFGASFIVIAEGDPATRLWTGMPYGHEGGLLGTGALVLGLLLIAAWVRMRRGGLRLHPSIAQPPTRPATNSSRQWAKI